MPDTDETPSEGQQINIPIEQLVGSYQRQLSELHHQIAIKDSLLEQAQAELVSLRELAAELEAQIRPQHHGRVTTPRPKGKR